MRSTNRRQQILEVLAGELETKPGSRITTAQLAAAVGVSEAALYRHFPSKAKMFEALIEFAEDAVFGLVSKILAEEPTALARCAGIARVTLRFAELNPGIARLLLGDVLTGEHERLRARVGQFFERLETQLRQCLREAAMQTGPQPDRIRINAAANLLAAAITGRIHQYVRSGFRARPIVDWDDEWELLARGIFTAE